MAKADKQAKDSGLPQSDRHYFEVKAALGSLYDRPENKLANGKENWDNYYQSQANFWKAVQTQEPDIATRLAYNLAK